MNNWYGLRRCSAIMGTAKPGDVRGVYPASDPLPSTVKGKGAVAIMAHPQVLVTTDADH